MTRAPARWRSRSESRPCRRRGARVAQGRGPARGKTSSRPDSWTRLALEHLGAGSDVALAIDDPELDVVAVKPLVVVGRRPMEQAPHVDATGDGLVRDLQA